MTATGATTATAAWLAGQSWYRPPWTVPELEAAKDGRTVSVVLPALNEAGTVAAVIDTITPMVGGLVDELIVLDSGSTDETEARACEAGARVVSREEALPEIPPQPGKGEALWRSLAATTGDIVVFIDSDLIDPDPMFVPRLLGPLLTRDGIHLVRGFYRRPLKLGDGEDANGGGRVTELVARPLLAALRPELGCVLQPLGGEYAGTRELLTSVPFAPGYGVEIGILVDTHARSGLAGIVEEHAHVLGRRRGRDRQTHAGIARLAQETQHARAQRNGAAFEQRDIVTGLGTVQTGNEVGFVDRGIEPDPLLREVGRNPLLAAGHPEQLAVALYVPDPVQARLRKGRIEGEAMSVAFRVGQRSVDVENECSEAKHR